MTLKGKKFFNSAIWPCLLGFSAGSVLILVDRVSLIWIIFWVLWSFTVLYVLFGIATDFELTKNFKAWISILGVLFAAYLINNTVVRRLSVPIFMILGGVILLALLILQIFGVKNRWKKLMMQFPVMLFSLATIIMALCQPTDRLFDTVGWCMLILTAVYLIAAVLSMQKK
ncbi:MAG: hypothetical protein IKB75_04100 [Clostridia bacterium]|nr:hypothetical protein [Clostridia bacterium]